MLPRLILLAAAGACGGDASTPPPIHLGDAAVTAGEPTSLAGITSLHNQARAMAYPAPTPALADLAWSDSLSATAQSWADGCEFVHSGGPYGENLYAAAGFVPDALDVVSSWVDENANYDYASNTCSDVCGHYTQVVWRGTTSLGCAIRQCTTGSPFSGFSDWTLVVCNYDPPGNSGGKPY